MCLEELIKKYKLDDLQVKRLRLCLSIHGETKNWMMEANFKPLYCSYTPDYFVEQIKEGYNAVEIFTKIRKDCVNCLVNEKLKKSGRTN